MCETSDVITSREPLYNQSAGLPMEQRRAGSPGLISYVIVHNEGARTERVHPVLLDHGGLAHVSIKVVHVVVIRLLLGHYSVVVGVQWLDPVRVSLMHSPDTR